MKIVKWIAVIGVVFIALTITMIAVAKHYRATCDKIRSKNGIEFQGYIKLNGVKQWICIRGENRDNPIILYLHGGPGSPESAMGSKKYQKEIEKSYVMVHWEQRGSAKSYSKKIANQDLRFEDLVNDAIVLSEYLIKKYNKQKIFLIGHSFGTMLGIEAITKRPDLYYGYIGLGQFVNAVNQENLSRNYVIKLAKERNDGKAIEALESIGNAPYKNTKKDIFTQRKYLTNSPGWSGPNYSLMKLIFDALICPYYSFGDYIKAFKGSMYSLDQMLTKDYWKFAYDQTHLSFEIPVFFISGTNDYNTPTELVKDYFNKISAPQKELILVENCGHLVNFEDPSRFNAEVCRLFGSVKTNQNKIK